MIVASPSKVFSSVLADGQPEDVAVGQHELPRKFAMSAASCLSHWQPWLRFA